MLPSLRFCTSPLTRMPSLAALMSAVMRSTVAPNSWSSRLQHRTASFLCQHRLHSKAALQENSSTKPMSRLVTSHGHDWSLSDPKLNQMECSSCRCFVLGDLRLGQDNARPPGTLLRIIKALVKRQACRILCTSVELSAHPSYQPIHHAC